MTENESVHVQGVVQPLVFEVMTYGHGADLTYEAFAKVGVPEQS